MISTISARKRVRLLISLPLLFLVLGTILMASELELSGFFMMCSFGASIIYGLSVFLRFRSGSLSITGGYKRIESIVVLVILIALCFVSLGESFAENMGVTILISQVLTFSIILAYLELFEKSKLRNAVENWGSIKVFAAIVFVAVSTLIIVLTIYETEPLVNILAFVYTLVLLVFAIRWFMSQVKLIIELKNENKKAELTHLQSQVNPHFFFNVLNNLYGTVGKDADKAQQLILKLSEMMRYSIYEGQKDLVCIEEEVNYIKNYIELQQMRYRKDIDIRFDVDLQYEGVKVLPLLFVIIVENAFKHGVEKLRSGAFVHLRVMANSKSVFLTVVNNYDSEQEEEKPGIGLVNLRRRLALVYPGKHDLTITNSNNIYKAQLSLEIL